MTGGDSRHGENGDEILDLPVVRHERSNSKDDHTGDADNREKHGELEFLQHLGDFDEEVGEFGFLCCGSPSHVNLEHVAKQSL